MEFLEQEHISPALLDGVRAYRAQYPAEPALQGRIPQPRYHYYGKEVHKAYGSYTPVLYRHSSSVQVCNIL